MRAVAILVVVLLLAGPAAAGVRTSWRAEDAIALAGALLADPDVRAAADERAPFALRVDVLDGADAAFVYEGSALREGDRPGAYVLRTTTDGALVAVNSDAPAHALLCLLAAGAATLTSPRAIERVALTAALARATRDDACLPRGVQVAEGVFVDDGAVFDRFGAPLGWQDPDAPRWLGRPEASITRLSPAQLPRGAEPDLADPWRAAATPAMRALLDAAADCPCDRGALVPAGDWRAALAADPRVEGGT